MEYSNSNVNRIAIIIQLFYCKIYFLKDNYVSMKRLTLMKLARVAVIRIENIENEFLTIRIYRYMLEIPCIDCHIDVRYIIYF